MLTHLAHLLFRWTGAWVIRPKVKSTMCEGTSTWSRGPECSKTSSILIFGCTSTKAIEKLTFGGGLVILLYNVIKKVSTGLLFSHWCTCHRIEIPRGLLLAANIAISSSSHMIGIEWFNTECQVNLFSCTPNICHISSTFAIWNFSTCREIFWSPHICFV